MDGPLPPPKWNGKNTKTTNARTTRKSFFWLKSWFVFRCKRIAYPTRSTSVCPFLVRRLLPWLPTRSGRTWSAERVTSGQAQSRSVTATAPTTRSRSMPTLEATRQAMPLSWNTSCKAVAGTAGVTCCCLFHFPLVISRVADWHQWQNHMKEKQQQKTQEASFFLTSL